MTDKPIDPLEVLKAALDAWMPMRLEPRVVDAIAALEAERAKVKKVAQEMRRKIKYGPYLDEMLEWAAQLDPSVPATESR